MDKFDGSKPVFAQPPSEGRDKNLEANQGRLLMIERVSRPSETPVLDKLTRKMAGAWRERRISDYMYKGFHTCDNCGVASDNRDHWVKSADGRELLTNSLAVHYLAFHRADVSPDELAKVASLAAAEVEPSDKELAKSRRNVTT